MSALIRLNEVQQFFVFLSFRGSKMEMQLFLCVCVHGWLRVCYCVACGIKWLPAGKQ